MGLDQTYHAHIFIFSSFFRLNFCMFHVVDYAGYTAAFYGTLKC